MNNSISFRRAFEALTENAPFPWQEALYDRMVKWGIPSSCNLPTGLGKTAIIPIWLIALANNPEGVPRRLVYIVNRRTVVDQATREAEKLRENLGKSELAEFAGRLRDLCTMPPEKSGDPPLAISTLRGQFADNGEWCADPARPAIVVGTIDMIGSRLLFSGYGLGRGRKPLHAGFLGQDTLIVHDEAHLEPAFQELLVALQKEQSERRTPDFHPLRVLELTATSRNTSTADKSEESKSRLLELSDADRRHAVVKRRIEAKKCLAFHPVDDEKTIADTISTRARRLAERHPDSAVLIFVRKVNDVEKIVKTLPADRTLQLTGTLRGKERDELVEKPVFQWFLPKSNRKAGVALPAKPVFLVCTSAGEVGIDISADHMVCDLTPFDSMAQRLGRVNRYGDGNAQIDVMYPETFDQKDPLAPAREKTLALFKQLPELRKRAAEQDVCRHDASPKALGELDLKQRQDAFTPKPTTLSTTDILFDAWALTTIRDKLPGRPPVEPYLHGIASWEPPETHVAWRKEVEVIIGDLLKEYRPKDLLDDYPLKPHELLRDNTDQVFKHLQKLAVKHAQEPVWIVAADSSVEPSTLGELARKDNKGDLNGKTVLLPPSVGGLRPDGSLDGSAESADDVADTWYKDHERTQQRRVRVWDDDPVLDAMRLVRTIDTTPDADEDESEDATGRRYWRWYELPLAADGEGSQNAQKPVLWQVHTDDVVRKVERFVKQLHLPDEIQQSLILAARFHDLGKKRPRFQGVLGNMNADVLLAKSGKRKRTLRLDEDCRHEFGSLLDIEMDAEFCQQSDEVKELVRHFIAAHHGRARPHFPADEAFDPESPEKVWNEARQEVPRRFARLQRKYGRWGLAYLESLLRAADWAASAEPSAFVADKQEEQS
jgi:CRISPR-associated endonuclease/helicase Cas3